MIIGITGKKGSGKDTVADFIVKNFPTAVKIAFADELKHMLLNNGICDYESLWGRKTHFSRKIMQFLGTEVVRKIKPNYWIEVMEEKINFLYSEVPKSIIVIPDVRFLNEAKFVKAHNGYIIRVNRKIDIVDNHASEIEQDVIHACHTIDNEHLNIEALEALTIMIVNDMKEDYEGKNTQVSEST